MAPTTPWTRLDFEFVLFASAVIDYDYIMGLIARFSAKGPGKSKMTREELIGLISADAKFMNERDDIAEYIGTLKAGEGLSETAIREGYTRFKAEKNTQAELADHRRTAWPGHRSPTKLRGRHPRPHDLRWRTAQRPHGPARPRLEAPAPRPNSLSWPIYAPSSPNAPLAATSQDSAPMSSERLVPTMANLPQLTPSNSTGLNLSNSIGLQACPNSNSIEFDGIKIQTGLNSFILTPKHWIEKTGANGIISSTGRYGGTYAHKDIAFEFASWVSVEFKLYLIKEFQRLKLEWNLQRTLLADTNLKNLK